MGNEWESQLWEVGLVALAGALGAIIGVEREFADKPAGLRTHILVCAASALLMLIGKGVLQQFSVEGVDSAYRADPLRIIQAIVIGISFLGAGTRRCASTSRQEICRAGKWSREDSIKLVCNRPFEFHHQVPYTKQGEYYLSTLERADSDRPDDTQPAWSSPLCSAHRPGRP
jgi:hypothetical protein